MDIAPNCAADIFLSSSLQQALLQDTRPGAALQDGRTGIILCRLLRHISRDGRGALCFMSAYLHVSFQLSSSFQQVFSGKKGIVPEF